MLGSIWLGRLNAVSLGFAAILLGLAADYGLLLYQEFISHPSRSLKQHRAAVAPSILWAAATTALAFFIWNQAMARLEAFEISVLQNTMLIQIAVLAWLFLGERFTLAQVPAMALVFIGVLIVQLRK